MDDLNPMVCLDNLAIPFLELVLDEAFSVLPRRFRRPTDSEYPTTIQDVANEACLPAGVVISKLKEIKGLSSNASIARTSENDTILDMRQIQKTQATSTLPGQWVTLKPGDLTAQFQSWQKVHRLVIIADNQEAAFSSVIFLRQKGLLNSYYLISDPATVF